MGSRTRGRALVALVVCAVLGVTAPAHAAQVFDLGQFLPDGVNGRDQVVGDLADLDDDDSDDTTAGVWRAGTVTTLPGTPSGGTSDALAINAAGRIVGTARGQNGLSALEWTPNGAGYALTTIPTFSGQSTVGEANAIDTAGDVVGTTNTGSTAPYTGAFELTGGSMIRVGDGARDPNPQNSSSVNGEGISADGSTVLTRVDGLDTVKGFYLVPGGSTAAGTRLSITPPHSGFNILGGNDGDGYQNDIASDGTIVGYTESGSARSFSLRAPGGALTPVDGITAVNAVNAKRTVVGTIQTGDPNDPVHAALWRNGTTIDLNTLLPPDSGFELVDALAVNDDGDVVGVAVHGQHEVGFLLKVGFTVDDAGDAHDKDTADGDCLTAAGTCTLRAALEQTNANASASPTAISFAIGTTALPKISPATPLPTIQHPVDLDATTQPAAITPGGRKIGVVLDGTSLAQGASGLDLAAGAAGSILEGLQVQNVHGDAVKLGAPGSQLADSVLVGDTTGAEVAASNVTVGSGSGRAGDVFFHDGDTPGLVAYLKSIKGQQRSTAAFQAQVAPYGAGIVLSRPSSGTIITGDEIGLHGTGFSADPDSLPADGVTSADLANATSLSAFGVLIEPTTGSIADVTIGGSGADADVIGGTIFGVSATAGGGATVDGLAVRSNTFGAERDGTTFDPLGGLIGLIAAGNVNGLSVGAPAAGNRFLGEVFGTILAGQQIASPSVQGNTYGVDEPMNGSATGHDVFGLLLADAQGVTVGGAGDGAGNQFVGDAIGLATAGDHLQDVSISHNTIGSAHPTHFSTFEKTDFNQFSGAFGVLAVGDAKPGQATTSQHMTLDANTVQGNLFGVFSKTGSGLTLRDNAFAEDALGLVDDGSSATQVGTAGHGNQFLDDGIGMVLTNEDLTQSDLDKAQVNIDAVSDSTRQQALGAADSDLGYDAVDALTTAALDPTSATTASTPGTAVKVLGNRFGSDAAGAAKPDEVPILLREDERGLQFGGTGAGEGNVVAHNRATGMLIAGHGDHQPSVQVLGNQIYDNENFTSTSLTGVPGLGIDLEGTQGGFGYGVNPQDSTQPDQGPNGFQNAPVLSSAVVAGGQITVSGTLHGLPSTTYVLEEFADDFANPFGAGEGQYLVARPTLTTDGAGNAAFATTMPAPPASARFVSATATTQPAGGGPGVTSEFAVDVQISAPGDAPPAPAPSSPARPGAPGTGGAAGAGSTTVGVTGGTIKASEATITLPGIVTCARAGGACTVTTTATIVKPRGSTRSVVRAVVAAKAKAKAKTTTVGRGALTLKPGASGRVTLKLSRSGFALLRRKRTLGATVTVTLTGKGQRTTRKVLKVKLRYVAPKKGKAKR